MPHDPESIARQLLDLVELTNAALVAPWAIASILGLEMRPRAPRGCVAALNLALRQVRVTGSTESARMWGLCHELGHLGLDVANAKRPHDEALVDEIAARLWVRPLAIRRALALAGWDGGELVRLMGIVPARAVFQRLTDETRAIAIVRHRGRRLVYAPAEFEVPTRPHAWELRWLRALEHGETKPALWGVEVHRFVDPGGGDGSVILVPPDACELVAARPEVLWEGWQDSRNTG